MSFSDTPCGEESTTLKKYRPAETVDDVPGNSKRERLLRAFEEERRQAEEKAERAMKCRHARDRLRVVRQAGRIYNVDDNGNRVIQTDEEFRMDVGHLRHQIEEDLSSALADLTQP